MGKSVFFLFTLISFSCFAGDPVQELLAKIHNKSDSAKAGILNDSAFALRSADFGLSIKYSEAAAEYARRSGFLIEEGNAYNNIGTCNHLQTRYKEAFIWYSRALEVYKKLNSAAGLASTYINMAVLFNDRGDLKSSIQYDHKALAYAKKSKQKRNLGSIYNNIAIAWQNLDNMDSALFYYYQSLAIRKELNNPDEVASTLENIGTVYYAMKDYRRALAVQLDGLKYDSLSNNLANKAIHINNIGSSYLMLHDYKNAERSSREALQIARNLNYVQLYPDIYYNLMCIYKESGQFEKSVDAAEHYIAIKDSVSNEDSRRLIAEMQAKFDSEEKEGEIRLLNTENAARREKNEQQRRLIYFTVGAGLIMLILSVLALRAYIQKRKANKVISGQYKELIVQKKRIHRQKDTIAEQNEHLEQVLGEIRQSITYAERIQRSILPPPDTLSNLVSRGFVLFRPKDVVSGDFYFFCGDREGDRYVAVADCTGHGIPGALMSMIGNEQLRRIIIEQGVREPGKILDLLHEGVKAALQQEKTGTWDGMDIILCRVAPGSEVTYAGANRNLYMVTGIGSEKTITELRTSRQPIGGLTTAGRSNFETFVANGGPGAVYYLCSDGYADQFGGPSGKKLLVKNLRNILLDISERPFDEQHEILERELLGWQGKYEQTDDVCVIGFQV